MERVHKDRLCVALTQVRDTLGYISKKLCGGICCIHTSMHVRSTGGGAFRYSSQVACAFVPGIIRFSKLQTRNQTPKWPKYSTALTLQHIPNDDGSEERRVFISKKSTRRHVTKKL